jgi:hypothetical protein
MAFYLIPDNKQGLTVRPEPFGYAQESPVEGWAVKPFMVRLAHHERLNLNLSRFKREAELTIQVSAFRVNG